MLEDMMKMKVNYLVIFKNKLEMIMNKVIFDVDIGICVLVVWVVKVGVKCFYVVDDSNLV